MDFLENNKIFKTAFAGIIAAEIFSFLGYFIPETRVAAFAAIAILTFILSLKRLEYGLYILLTELFIGSFGYLFFIDIFGAKISLRAALFLIILSIWLARFLLNFKISWQKIRKNKFSKAWFLLIAVVLIGAIRGLFNNHDFNNVFFDANAYLYFLLFFVFFEVIDSPGKVKNIIQLLLAAALALSLKTLFLFFIFSHGVWENTLPNIYKWLRDFRIAEITPIQPDFFRIFLQSQIYAVFAFLLCLPRIAKSEFYSLKNVFIFLTFPILMLGTIIISFSRSFWIGLAAGLLFILIYYFKKMPLPTFGAFLSKIILASILALLIVFLLSPSFSLLLLKSRMITVESAASTRLLELQPLRQGIKEKMFWGHGFGKILTFQSRDPRILAIEPAGLYTTYAFEWGYLDIWLKIGLIGFLIYLFFIGKIFYLGFKNLNFEIFGLLSGLVALLIINIFSPYLNHPLGIGYLMLTASIVYLLDKSLQDDNILI